MLTTTVSGHATHFPRTKTDPIFEAIETHRNAWIESARASCAACRAEDDIDRSTDPRPSKLIHWRGHDIGGDEIDDLKAAFLEGTTLPADQIEAEYQSARSRYQQCVAQYEDWELRNRITELNNKRDETYAAEMEAAVALTNVAPTTLEGVLALFDYIDSFNRGELKISEGWYSDPELWPSNLTDEDVLNGRGNPAKMEFAWWVLRNAQRSLSAILSPNTGTAPLHA